VHDQRGGTAEGVRHVWAAAGGCGEAVLDAEVVAVDRDNGNALKSFQDLSTRARGATALHEARALPPVLHAWGERNEKGPRRCSAGRRASSVGHALSAWAARDHACSGEWSMNRDNELGSCML
jgi:hypothetical protein